MALPVKPYARTLHELDAPMSDKSGKSYDMWAALAMFWDMWSMRLAMFWDILDIQTLTNI